MMKNYFLNLLFLTLSYSLLAQTVCEEQLGIDNGFSGQSHGQSVTMTGCSGFFNAIEFHRRDPGSAITTAVLKIYNNQDVTGTPMYTQNNVVIPATTDTFTIELSGGTGSLAFTEGNQYSFIINNTPTFQTFVDGTNPYAGGQGFLNNGFLEDFDLWFKVTTSTDDPLSNRTLCQEQTTINNGVSGQSHGQSVTMTGCSGFFNAIEFHRRDPGSALTTAVLKIYNNQDVTGTPMYTQNNVVIPATTDTFTIELSGGTGSLAFTEGNQYSFIINNTPTFQLEIAGGDPYDGGQLFLNNAFLADGDLWFKLITVNDNSLSIEDNNANDYKLYPNPSSDFLVINGMHSEESYKIYNTLGQEVKKGIALNNSKIDIKSLNTGLYFIKFDNRVTLRFLKK